MDDYILCLSEMSLVLERLSSTSWCIEPFPEMFETHAVLYRVKSRLVVRAESCQEGTAIQSPADVAGQGADVKYPYHKLHGCLQSSSHRYNR